MATSTSSGSRKRASKSSSKTYQVPVDRQKAAQAAGNYDLEDLPGQLSDPSAAARVGKSAKQDKIIRGARSLGAVTRLSPGSGLAVYGRPEYRWATSFFRKRGEVAEFYELLSYARQLVGMRPDGGLAVCLCGHAGQGDCIPLWAPREELSLTVQPNDLILRFDDMPFLGPGEGCEELPRSRQRR